MHKRSRMSQGNADPPPEGNQNVSGQHRPESVRRRKGMTCLVEECGKKLTKPYDKKCRTCVDHRRVSHISIDGKHMRFCQKCNIFEDLSDFDGERRTCRARLKEHNRCQRRLRALHLQHLAARQDSAEPVDQAPTASSENIVGVTAENSSLSAPANPVLATDDTCALADPLSEMETDVDVFAQLSEGLETHGSSGDSSSALLPGGAVLPRIGSTAHGDPLELDEILPWLDSAVPGFPGDIVTVPPALPAGWGEPQ